MPATVLLDLFAIGWFLCGWLGYAWFADRRAADGLTLMNAMHGYRVMWMRRLLQREVRVVDATIAGNLNRAVIFLASTTILILAGLIAVLGSVERAIEVVGALRFAVASTPEIWELKLFSLILLFVYAFFKFTWAVRHFNYLSVLIGAAPEADSQVTWSADYAARAARVSSHAANTFNRGLRAYYFGLAMLAWFLHPLLFILATALVIGVLYRREFHSRMLRELGNPAEFVE
ncbi:MAG TPA: DUF599 domain-containing protein [Gammaproteobacteria bacterium]